MVFHCSVFPQARFIDFVTQSMLLVFEKLPFSRPSTFGHLGFWQTQQRRIHVRHLHVNGDQHKTCVNDQILAAEQYQFREQGLPRSSRFSIFFTFLMIIAAMNLQKREATDAIAHQLFHMNTHHQASKTLWEKLTRIAIVCVLELYYSTCLFLPDQPNVLGAESAPLDVVTDVGFGYVLGQASDHYGIVGGNITSFFITIKNIKILQKYVFDGELAKKYVKISKDEKFVKVC